MPSSDLLNEEPFLFNYFRAYRLRRRCYSLDPFILRRLDIYHALFHLRPNHLGNILLPQQDERRRQTPLVISVDKNTFNGRYWLVGLSNGHVSVFDSHQIQKQSNIQNESFKNPLSFPLGYVPSDEEIRRSSHQVQDTISPSFTASLHFPSQPSGERVLNQIAFLTQCKWIPHERGGVLTSSLNGHITVWDIEHCFSSSTQFHKLLPLFTIKALSTLYNFSQMGEYVSAASQYQNITSTTSSLVACCSANSNIPIVLLDLRVGAFVGTLRTNQQNRSLSSDMFTDSTCASWSPRNPSHLMTGHSNGSLRMWDIRKGGGESLFRFDRLSIDKNFEIHKTKLYHESQDYITPPGSRVEQLHAALRKYHPSLNEKTTLSADLEQTKTIKSEQPQQPLNRGSLASPVPYHTSAQFKSEQEMWNYIKTGGNSESKQNPKVDRIQKKQTNTMVAVKSRDKSARTSSAIRLSGTKLSVVKSFTKSQQIKPSLICKSSNRLSFTTTASEHPHPSTTPSPHSSINNGHHSPITNITFINYGDFVLSSSLSPHRLLQSLGAKEHIRLWNPWTGELCPVYFEAPQQPFNSALLKKEQMQIHIPLLQSTRGEVFEVGNGREFYCVGIGTGVAIYDIYSGELKRFVQSVHQDRISSLISNDSPPSAIHYGVMNSLISGSDDGTVKLWRGDVPEITNQPEFYSSGDNDEEFDSSVDFTVEILSRQLRSS